jgi:hypothetical protein
MSRTFRRKNQHHDYEWILIDWKLRISGVRSPLNDPRSILGRKAIAHCHSDSQITMSSSAPRRCCKAYDNRLSTRNDRQMRKWLAEPAFDSIFKASHRHDANYS